MELTLLKEDISPLKAGGLSVTVTTRHYDHWIKGRQEKLEEVVKNSWAHLGAVS
jgi:F0F1-type ATP synthase delta subunit